MEKATPDKSGPWNPGIESHIPDEVMGLSSLLRKENISNDAATVLENYKWLGPPLERFVTFKPERLALHELLIRVTCDLHVPEGKEEQNLGRNFRAMVQRLTPDCIDAHQEEYAQIAQEARNTISQKVDKIVDELQPPPAAAPAKRSFLGRFRNATDDPSLTGAQSMAQLHVGEAVAQHEIIENWGKKGATAPDPWDRRIYRACHTVFNQVRARSESTRMFPSSIESAKQLVVSEIANDYASEKIGEAMAPHFTKAAQDAGYSFLPTSASPVALVSMGASAAGKTSLRPNQRKQVEEKLGVGWDSFSCISPDIWRKAFLDYESLGDVKRYAGPLTSDELIPVDRKLDRYMHAKAQRGEMPNVLIDRFHMADLQHGTHSSDRYTGDASVRSLFFVVTPPEATVDRAWERGEKTGRYRAVSDTLEFNRDTYRGFPKLWEAWLDHPNPSSHFELLDNSVPKGTPPRLIAEGTKEGMRILDFTGLVNIDRFAKISPEAQSPGEVYQGSNLSPEENLGFFRKCTKRFSTIDLADRDTNTVYARIQAGERLEILDEALTKTALKNPDAAAALSLLKESHVAKQAARTEGTGWAASL